MDDTAHASLFWLKDLKKIPARPDNPESYPEDDIRRWYDHEYAGYFLAKKAMPSPPKPYTPRGKHIACIHPGKPAYLEDFAKGILEEAKTNGIRVTFFNTSWDMDIQAECTRKAIELKPDLVIMVPENTNSCVEHYRLIHEAGIPLICSNCMPEPDVYTYVISWTGPDDWGQYRSLAHAFAELMHGEGAYCIVRHLPGTSPYLARTWGFISELRRISPGIQLLDAQTSYLQPLMTEKLVESWINQYGLQLKGIVSSGDYHMQLAINNAVRKSGRQDIARVCVASNRKTLEMVRNGTVHAVAYQNGLMDGALAVQTAVDWFSGLKVEPVRNLPRFIVNRNNVLEFINKQDTPPKLDTEGLFAALKHQNSTEVDQFFDALLASLQQVRFVKEEFLRGYIIQIFSIMSQVLKLYNIDTDSLLGPYDSIYKQLFGQQSLEESLAWLRNAAVSITNHLRENTNALSSLNAVIEHIDLRFQEPVSLQTLSYEYGISAAYLGQQFKKTTGKSFTDYINGLRIQRAKELLSSTDLKEKSIALEVGYADHNYFYRVFKKYEGMSPSQFRKACCEAE